MYFHIFCTFPLLIQSRDGMIFVEQGDTSSDSFRREASWFARQNLFFEGYTSFESVHRQGFYIRHRNRRLQLTRLSSGSDRNDASFLMTDAYSGAGVSQTVEEEWRRFLGRNVQVHKSRNSCKT